MTKRKSDSDLLMEEGKSKQQKSEVKSKYFDGMSFPGLIDFTEIERRQKYRPDTVITSKDGTKIYYHINKLVDIEFFDKLYNGNIEEAKSGNVKLEYDTVVIMLMLNFVEHPESFTIKSKIIKNNFGQSDALFQLTILAHYIQFPDLEAMCYNRWEMNHMLNLELIEMYGKHNRDNTALKLVTINGKKNIDKDVPKTFLSECYDLGMTFDKDAVILNIIPFYDPSPEQLLLFKICSSDYKIDNGTCTPAQLKWMKINSLKNIGSETTLNKFMEKYKGVVGNPGVTKFLGLLASCMFM